MVKSKTAASPGWASAVLSVLVWLAAATPLSAQEAPHPLELTGFQPGRGYLSVLPWESIDVFSGSVVLTFTDLVLPGNAGLDVNVTRVYNSKKPWHWTIGIGPMVFDPPEPVPNPLGIRRNPEIWGVDGSEQVTFETGPGSGVFLTPGYARYTRATQTLEQPDGRVYVFDQNAFPIVEGQLRLRQMRDVFGNTIDLYYDGWRIRAVQHLGGQQERVVSLLHDNLGQITAVTYSSEGPCEDWGGQPIPGRPCARWLYGRSASGDTRTLAVTPPTGPGWLLESTSAAGAGTLTVTTPNGGRVAYDFGMFPYPARKTKGFGTAYTRKLSARRTAGRAEDYDPDAAWTFSYPGQGHDVTVVQGPTRRVRYLSGETGNTTTYLATELVYKPDDPSETTLMGKTEYAYRPIGSQVPGSPDPVGLVPAWPDPWDPEIVRSDPYPLLLSQVTRSRPKSTGGMRDYVRQFWYCGQTGQPACPAEPTNDAGRPIRMVETGDFARTTAMTYRHSFGWGVYLRGIPTSQAVTVGAETFTTTDTHTDLGFLQSRNQFGTVTTYAPTDAGNLASVTNARQYTTSVTYEWGVRKNTETPEFTIARTINPDGTLQSVTQNGATTTFEYDALGRQTRIDPPIGHDTWTTYAEDGTWVEVARGTSWTRTDLDGFGRAVGTVNSQGVHTETEYDAIGRTRSVRAPWNAAHPEERRTTFTHDVWDLVTKQTNPDGKEVLTAYTVDDNGLLTTITDENGHTTVQRWQATGSPDEARLQAVTDALGHTTSYAYNTLGSLTTVTSPGGVVRTWAYNTKNQLASQTQPEFGTQGEPARGTVTYHYDAVGNVDWQTDAEGWTTSYTYDGNNRLTLVTSPDAMYLTTISYDDANNRTSMSNGYVSTTFVYDEANRLTQRTDALNNRTFVSGYTFDDHGNVVDVQYPSGNHVEYGYDSENRVTSVSDPARGLTFASTITYHPAGGLAGYTSGDGVAHTIDYDSRARPFRIAAAGVLDLRYQDQAGQPGYDPAGNLTSLIDALRPDRNATFAYDALDRLTTANGGGWGALQYWYDDLGNRTQQTHGTVTTHYTYTDHQRMQITGAASLLYDKNGNLTQDAIGSYTYTPGNMLETVRPVAGGLYLYHYDGDGQRALKRQGSTKTTTYLRGLGQVLSEFEEEGQQLRWTLDQVYLGSQLLAATRPPAGLTPLTIGKAGAGTGTVTSTPSGINCGPACGGATGAFPGGTVVSLSATPAVGWVFVGWSGDLDCADGVVTLTDPKSCVATFALTAPLFTKQAPGNGGSSGTRRVTLQWAAAPNASYVVCWDTTNNGVCDATWQWNATATRRVVEFPEPGTYYWQVRTFSASPTEADEGAWWSVTVTGPPLYTKITPGHGAGGLGTTVTLQWTPVPNEGYAVCWDTTNNNTCDSAWWPNGGATARVLEGLSAGTYYWQVRTAGGVVLADNGVWHAFTVSMAALYTKQAPGNGATGLGSTVTLQWTAVPEEGYAVCWDTSDNGACDSAWWPNGGATARVLEGLSAGTYYWQVRTAGGAVLADNGAWHHFTVGAAPLAASTAGASGEGAPDLASAEHRSTGGAYAAGVAGAAGLTLMVLLAGPQRRRRAVAAGVLVFVLAPAAAQAQATTQVVEYYTTDAIGSVRAVTKRVNGVLQVTRHDFMPFGEEVSPQYPPPDKRLFTGKERDSETGLDYFEARYLRASAGRFTTVDPVMAVKDNLLEPQRWNRYAYAKNNPLAFIDPDGRDIIYAGNLKNAQKVKDSVQAILADPRTAGNLSGYVGPNNPNLTIQSGDLSAGDTRTVNPDGSVTTTTVMGNTATDIQTTSSSSTDMNGVTTTTGPETTLKGATITIDNRTGSGEIPGVMVHEGVHAGEARANPAKFAKDAAAEKSIPNHDARPQEQRANAAQKTYAKGIQDAVKRIERDRK